MTDIRNYFLEQCHSDHIPNQLVAMKSLQLLSPLFDWMTLSSSYDKLFRLVEMVFRTSADST